MTEFWDKIDRSLGLAGPDPVMVRHFREAGFDEDHAAQGAQMMASGRYFGFVDAATSLAMAAGRGMSPIRQTRIAEVGARVDGAASSAGAVVEESASGRKVSLDEEDYQRLLTKGDRLRALEEENTRLRAERKQLRDAGVSAVGWDAIDETLGLGGGQ